MERGLIRVHFIGIGGAGLSAIALILLENGYQVSGSDRAASTLSDKVRTAGGRVYLGHKAENVSGADLVIRSSAVPDDNVEVQAARRLGIPVLKRADFMGRLMVGRKGIAVAGTHGKTTTAAMIAWTLVELGQDPSFILGGIASNLDTNAHVGQGSLFVIEADEYDRMFLGLNPSMILVTNVEYDHPDCFPTPQDFFRAFEEFVGRIETHGQLLACVDDPGASKLLDFAAAQGVQTLSYGLGDALEGNRADFLAVNLEIQENGCFSFDALYGQSRLARVALQVPGQHNVQNALGTMAASYRLGLDCERAAQALGKFTGVGRRFEILGEEDGIAVIDDYAHHPTEIRATLSAARARYPGWRIWAVWQPHTFSRTQALLDKFAEAFVDADRVVVTDIFAARETRPDDFSFEKVVSVLHHPKVEFIPDLRQVSRELLSQLRQGDVLLVLSAGDANLISREVFKELSERRNNSDG